MYSQQSRYYLPFLIVFRPSRGSSTGSTLSSTFSMKTVSPLDTAPSIMSRYLKSRNIYRLWELSYLMQRTLHALDFIIVLLTIFRKACISYVNWLAQKTLPSLSEPNYFQAILVSVLDPSNSLELRIDDQRPALAISQDRRVFGGHAIGRKTFVVPGRNVSVVCKNGQGIETLGRRYWNLQNIRNSIKRKKGTQRSENMKSSYSIMKHLLPVSGGREATCCPWSPHDITSWNNQRMKRKLWWAEHRHWEFFPLKSFKSWFVYLAG